MKQSFHETTPACTAMMNAVEVRVWTPSLIRRTSNFDSGNLSDSDLLKLFWKDYLNDGQVRPWFDTTELCLNLLNLIYTGAATVIVYVT